ncbi:MAG: ornithine cyclodeaminase [Methylococcales bacterium]
MKLIEIFDLRTIIRTLGLLEFNRRVLDTLENHFTRWNEFQKTSRHATDFENGVIELMPCSDRRYYAFKYVNGHPFNTLRGKLSIVAFGVLADADSGYPLLISEMTLLTAFRTAGTAALAAKYLAKPDSKVLAMIGTGAQAEFQFNALRDIFPLQVVRFHDTDKRAMQRFGDYLRLNTNIRQKKCLSAVEVVSDADIIVTATADRRPARLFGPECVRPGVHINALGGDCPGKTEIDPELLGKSKLVVEFLDQTSHEGEIQNLENPLVYAELWELVSGHKPGRETEYEITLFDSVGFALEDFAMLKLIYDLADEMDLGRKIDLIPEPGDPKNLFGILDLPNSADKRSAINLKVRRSRSKRG